MQNLCPKCGGGFGQYAAPETRCTCVTAAQKKELRHALALSEANYLRSQGWEPLDVLNGLQGYTWKAPEVYGGHSPISQDVALEVQKKIDVMTLHPVKDTWLMGVSTTQLKAAMHETDKHSKMKIAELQLQRALHI